MKYRAKDAIRDVKWESIRGTVENLKKGKIPASVTNQLKNGVLEDCVYIFSNIPVVNNKPTDCILNIRDKLKILELPDGRVVGFETLRHMIKVTTELVSRSHFFYESENRDNTLFTLTPLIMYALKLYKNIPYEFWDKEDPLMKSWLGETLYEALIANMEKQPPRPLEEWKKLRDYYVSKGNKGSFSYGPSKWETRLKGWKKDLPEKLEKGIMNVERFNDIYLHIKMQTWIANPEQRIPGVMILDTDNWDNVPEPFEPIDLPKPTVIDALGMSSKDYGLGKQKIIENTRDIL